MIDQSEGTIANEYAHTEVWRPACREKGVMIGISARGTRDDVLKLATAVDRVSLDRGVAGIRKSLSTLKSESDTDVAFSISGLVKLSDWYTGKRGPVTVV